MTSIARLAALRRLLPLAAAALLAACASLPQPPAADRVHAGRFAATTTLDGRSENSSGRFTLAVQGERLTLDLATPLGTTLARIDVDAQGALLQVPGAGGLQQARGRDAERLAADLLGYPLPVSGIADWIEGRPSPQRPAQLLALDGGAQRIVQDGWTIDVADRYASGAVRRLAFARPAQPALGAAAPIPAITLRLVLDEHADSAATASPLSPLP